jgi:hypothetical protein
LMFRQLPSHTLQFHLDQDTYRHYFSTTVASLLKGSLQAVFWDGGYYISIGRGLGIRARVSSDQFGQPSSQRPARPRRLKFGTGDFITSGL